jgi:hypothetical protein|tara:strand:+ start:502 stop:690 length:189 start_codon:yes stop_codon:yes gene_type:complete
MKVFIEMQTEVEYEIHITEEPTCDIFGVWITLPCGTKLFNLQPFMHEGEVEDLSKFILEQEG